MCACIRTCRPNESCELRWRKSRGELSQSVEQESVQHALSRDLLIFSKHSPSSILHIYRLQFHLNRRRAHSPMTISDLILQQSCTESLGCITRATLCQIKISRASTLYLACVEGVAGLKPTSTSSPITFKHMEIPWTGILRFQEIHALTLIDNAPDPTPVLMDVVVLLCTVALHFRIIVDRSEPARRIALFVCCQKHPRIKNTSGSVV